MDIKDLFESSNDIRNSLVASRAIGSERNPRLTLRSLLKLRKVREHHKLEKLKDLELYYIMYRNETDEGGF